MGADGDERRIPVASGGYLVPGAGTPQVSCGNSLVTALNSMARWPVSEIRRVLDDEQATAIEVAAARIVLSAASAGRERGADVDRMLDRTIGKPKQTQSLEVKQQATPEQLINEARRLAGLDPLPKQVEQADTRSLPIQSALDPRQQDEQAQQVQGVQPPEQGGGGDEQVGQQAQEQPDGDEG